MSRAALAWIGAVHAGPDQPGPDWPDPGEPGQTGPGMWNKNFRNAYKKLFGLRQMSGMRIKNFPDQRTESRFFSRFLTVITPRICYFFELFRNHLDKVGVKVEAPYSKKV